MVEKASIKYSPDISLYKKTLLFDCCRREEKRNPQRRVEDRGNHPVRTFINVLFAIGVVSGATVLMLVLLALYSSIIEF